ncbi:MAG: hypothetical protein ACJAYU_000723 [Bradymonadia bacterium]
MAATLEFAMTGSYEMLPALIPDDTGIRGFQISDGNAVAVRGRSKRSIVSISRLLRPCRKLMLSRLPIEDWMRVAA